MKKKEIAFRIFHSICLFLCVYTYGLLRKLTGDSTVVLWANLLVIFLFMAQNITILVLYDKLKENP